MDWIRNPGSQGIPWAEREKGNPMSRELQLETISVQMTREEIQCKEKEGGNSVVQKMKKNSSLPKERKGRET